jgi:hypothetical protein
MIGGPESESVPKTAWRVWGSLQKLHHFSDRTLKTDGERAGDDRKSDVHFFDLRNLSDTADVLVIKPMPGRDSKAECPGPGPGSLEHLKFSCLRALCARIRVATRVQLDHRCSSLPHGVELAEYRVDEKAHLNVTPLEYADDRLNFPEQSHDIKAALCGQLLTTFRDKCDLSGLNGERNPNNLLRDRHLKIQAGRDRALESLNISILDVAPVLT